jgi:hypothetical protein
MARRLPTSSQNWVGALFRTVQRACNRPASVREVFLVFLLAMSIFWISRRPAEAVYDPFLQPGNITTWVAEAGAINLHPESARAEAISRLRLSATTTVIPLS